jgi:hypothetical protein
VAATAIAWLIPAFTQSTNEPIASGADVPRAGYYGVRTDIPEAGSNRLALDIDGSLLRAEHGNIYFTDPPYGLAGQINDSEKELDFRGIYLIGRSDKKVELLATQTRLNGIGLSPDERTLAIESDGTRGDRRVFFDARETRS